MVKEYLSQEKYDELIRELEYLRMEKRKEVAERLEFAKSLGDLSENAEYHSAREEQAEIEDRINQLEAMLKNAGIISASHGSTVEIGSTLVVHKKGESKDYTYTIVGSEEVDMAQGRISYLSPIGAKLLGKKKGDEVVVDTPRGLVTYKVVSVK